MKKFKSKVSYGMLIAIFLLFFVPEIIGILNNGINDNLFLLNGILISTYAFILHMFLKTDYTIDNKKLKIRCGFIYKSEIEIDKIKSITKTSSILSSPAPSFDRIEIKYGKYDVVIISPKDKIAFAKELTDINPKIENNLIV
ncbi:MAG: PH domain-containing protein [Chlorobi bacterium]|nr:PH domain-containing protein [Chlorobiota bacterium]